MSTRSSDADARSPNGDVTEDGTVAQGTAPADVPAAAGGGPAAVHLPDGSSVHALMDAPPGGLPSHTPTGPQRGVPATAARPRPTRSSDGAWVCS